MLVWRSHMLIAQVGGATHTMELFGKLVGFGLIVLGAAMIWQSRNTMNVEEFYKGKRVIVTGASKGIGKSLSVQLAKLGAKLVIAARTADKLTETQQECQQYTPHVHTVVADVSKETDCKAIVEKTVAEFGGVDILILNAAYSPVPQWFTEFENPGEHFSGVFGVNVLQSIYLVQHALPYLNASQGYIVPVSSASAISGMPKVVPYATSKHALHGFFKGLNQEFIMTNTHVSITIMPLPFVLTQKAVDNWKPIGTGRGITPDDCAEKMIRGIPLRKLWYYIDWEVFFIGHLYSLWPEFFDSFVRIYLPQTSHLF